MAATQLHVGDLVRLKTGSPIVKIHRIHQGTALCRWCNGKKKDWGIFELESLVPASNKGGFAPTTTAALMTHHR